MIAQQTATVVVLKLADLDPFGDVDPDPVPLLGVSDRCRDENVFFNSAI